MSQSNVSDLPTTLTPMRHTSHCPEMVRRCLSLQMRNLNFLNIIAALFYGKPKVDSLELLVVLQEEINKSPEWWNLSPVIRLVEATADGGR